MKNEVHRKVCVKEAFLNFFLEIIMSNINLFPELDDEQGESEDYSKVRNDIRGEDELIVFGYSCKLFRDDFSAKAIDRGQSLIPWNGDENVMIDRCAKSDVLFLLLIFLFIISIDKSLNEEKQNIDSEKRFSFSFSSFEIF